VRALRSNRDPVEKSYEAVIDGTINVRAYSQREAVEEVKKFMKRSGIRPHDNHIQVFLKREQRKTETVESDGDRSKEAL
jgi:ABC-type histidine transport system ATPase subunit